MSTRIATCRCGQAAAACEGEPILVSVCHCLACQRRTGSSYGYQARWPEERVRIEGRHTSYERLADHGPWRRTGFCPDCGSTVFYRNEDLPGVVAVTVGAFADPSFPQPTVSVWESRRHTWLELPDDMVHETE